MCRSATMLTNHSDLSKSPCPMPEAPSTLPGDRCPRQILTSWWRWTGAIAAAAALIAAAQIVPFLRPARAYVAPIAFLYLPFLLDRTLSARQVGLTVPNRSGLVAAIVSGAIIAAGFFIVTRFFLWGPWPGPPQSIGERLLAELLFAALPEELFFRGWLQPQADRLLGGRAWGRGTFRLTAANLVTAAAFAVIHLVTGRIDRLSVFFPGLWFGWLTECSGSIWPAIVLHALSNLGMAAASGY
ncbi:MAG: CPBP family intramembrane metalloprotease [Candidatus Dadabacteria bacterium]|nr:MAG: CPBP family intramembrane metalloprotease [Candidatus Dadabacteria bacterium]